MVDAYQVRESHPRQIQDLGIISVDTPMGSIPTQESCGALLHAVIIDRGPGRTTRCTRCLLQGSFHDLIT